MKRVVVFGIAIALIAVGVAMGQPESVLAKAIRICLECVGLG